MQNILNNAGNRGVSLAYMDWKWQLRKKNFSNGTLRLEPRIVIKLMSKENVHENSLDDSWLNVKEDWKLA